MRFATRSLGLLLVAACASSVRGATHIVAFGGGPSPSNDQVSLLSNAAYFDRVRHLLGVEKAPYELYFGDGGVGNTVKTTARADNRQELVNVLSQLIYGNDQADVRFRRADLTDIVGPSTQENLEKWFDGAAKRLVAHDRLVLYFTGHGGADQQNTDDPRNTTMFMWGSPAGYTVKRFEAQLDKLDPQVEATLIMVQCHSGGFANVIYKDGNPSKGFATSLRAGFFSTTAPRLAAGCTAEISEEDYHEFSTSFFEALCGESRTGKQIPKADYDGDGRVSFAEAFNYAVMTAPTIDIPMCTSDQLLRDKSRFHKAGDPETVLAKNGPWSQVISAATPAQKVALEHLSEKLGLTGEDRLSAAVKLADVIDKEWHPSRPRRMPMDGPGGMGGPTTGPAETGAPATQPAFSRFGGRGGRNGNPEMAARRRLLDGVLRRWPELGVPFDPNANAIIDAEGPKIMAFLKSQPEYATMTSAAKLREDAQVKQEKAELRWVQVQRLLDRANSVALANNLPAVANEETQKVYATLLRLENKSFDRMPDPAS